MNETRNDLDLVETHTTTAGDFEAVIRRGIGDDYYKIEVYRLPRGPFDHSLSYGNYTSSLPRARRKAGRLLDQMRLRAATGWEHTEVLR